MKDKVSARDDKQPQRTGGLEETKKLLIVISINAGCLSVQLIQKLRTQMNQVKLWLMKDIIRQIFLWIQLSFELNLQCIDMGDAAIRVESIPPVRWSS